MKNSARLTLVAIAALGLIGAGCAKKKVAAAPPAAPQPTAQAPAQQAPAPAPARSNPAPVERASAPPEQRMPTPAEKARIETLLARIEDAYFDYNQHTLRPDAIKALQAD